MSSDPDQPIVGPGSDIRSIIQDLLKEGKIEEAGELQAAESPTVYEALCGSDPPLLNRIQGRQAAQEAQARGISLPAAAIELGFASKEAVLSALSKSWGTPFVDLEKKEISLQEIRQIRTPEFVWKSVLPLAIREGMLCLAMANPLNRLLIEHIERLTSKKVRPFLALVEDILRIIQKLESREPG